MKNSRRFIFAIAALSLAVLACQGLSGLANVLFSDDFSTERWGIGTDADSSVEYANETLQFIVYTPNLFVWSTPNDEDYSNVHIEVTAINNGSDPNTAFGLYCNLQVTDATYYFAVTVGGEYAIAKSSVALDDVFLTNNDTWGQSDLIPVNAASYRVGADCASDGTLTLYVNGQQIDSVNDTDYTSGSVALFVLSGEGGTTNISFDDFEVTRLP